MENSLNNIFNPPLTKKQILELSPLALAFIGDGVHTLMVRDFVVKNSGCSVGSYHKMSARLCNAKAQSVALDLIYDTLSEEEKDIVRRARNAKTNNIAKNSDLETYKKATAYEALIGQLYLLGDYNRIKQIVKLNLQEGKNL